MLIQFVMLYLRDVIMQIQLVMLYVRDVII